MYTNFYKDGELVMTHEHKHGISFEDTKDVVIEMLCTAYPHSKVDEAVTVSKRNGSFRTKLSITQLKIN